MGVAGSPAQDGQPSNQPLPQAPAVTGWQLVYQPRRGGLVVKFGDSGER